MIAKFEDFAEGFENSSSETSEVVNADIIETRCFGLNHDVTVIAKDGSVSIKIDPSTGET